MAFHSASVIKNPSGKITEAYASGWNWTGAATHVSVLPSGMNQMLQVTNMTLTARTESDVEVYFGTAGTSGDLVEGIYAAANGGLHADYSEENFPTSTFQEGLYMNFEGTAPSGKAYIKYRYLDSTP